MVPRQRKRPHTSAPKIACPSASGKIFRSCAKNATPSPSAHKTSAGTSTGFGQCSAANKTPAISAPAPASQMPQQAIRQKRIQPTCCNTQNAKYPQTSAAPLSASAIAAASPKTIPRRKTAALAAAKNTTALRVAVQRLSARHPHCLRRVPPHKETRYQPHQKHPPSRRHHRLPPPDVPSHIRDESNASNQAGNPPRAPTHAQFPTRIRLRRAHFDHLSTLSNCFSISASDASSGARNSFKSKSGNPRFVIRAGSNSAASPKHRSDRRDLLKHRPVQPLRKQLRISNPANSTRVPASAAPSTTAGSVFL